MKNQEQGSALGNALIIIGGMALILLLDHFGWHKLLAFLLSGGMLLCLADRITERLDARRLVPFDHRRKSSVSPLSRPRY